MVHILVEENYTNNNRLSVILNGITCVLKKKRMAIKLHKKMETIPESTSVVIVIYASLNWVKETVEKLNEKRVHPILLWVQDVDTMYKYSGLTFSFTQTMYQLTKYVLSQQSPKKAGKAKTAFLGYNDDSTPDKLKKRGVAYAVEEAGGELVVFKNRGNVGECIRDFLQNGQDVDTIVCGNDSIAVILRTLYPEALQGRQICSCSGLKISQYVDDPYPTTFIDYYEAGKRLAELYLFINKSETIAPTVMNLQMGICVGKEQLFVDGFPQNSLTDHGQIINYYGDESVKELDNLDRMLLNCDEMDIKILKGLLEGLSYEQVAELHYFSANTVKYRVHLMMKNGGGYASKKDLLAEIEKYGLKF